MAANPTPEFQAMLAGGKFVYLSGDVRFEALKTGSTLTLHYSDLTAAGAYDHLEQIADGFWALAPEAGLSSIEISYRGGDPNESVELRPRR